MISLNILNEISPSCICLCNSIHSPDEKKIPPSYTFLINNGFHVKINDNECVCLFFLDNFIVLRERLQKGWNKRYKREDEETNRGMDARDNHRLFHLLTLKHFYFSIKMNFQGETASRKSDFTSESK